MEKYEEVLKRAIKDLRETMGLSQISFATRVGKSYPMIQRYEGQKPPTGVGLVPFVYLAREANRLDLARLFKQAVLEEIPAELIQLIRERGPEDEEAAAQSVGHKRKIPA